MVRFRWIIALYLCFGHCRTVCGNCSGGVTSQTVSYGDSGVLELMLPSVIKTITCTWEVKSNTNALLLDLVNFIIPDSDHCEQGSLEVTVGEYGKFDSVSLDTFCGEFYPRSLRLSGHVMIRLHLKSTDSRIGFKLKYTSILPSEFCPTPDRNLTGSGFIYSPGYGGHWTLAPSLSCNWQIEADPGHVVQVELIHVDFSEWACSRQQAKLAAYDGNALFNEIGSWCTSDVLNVVKSTRSGLHLTYINKVPHRGTGFYLKYYQVPDYHSDCAVYVREVTARQTPSFIQISHLPNQGPKSCRWNITAEKENELVVMETEYYNFGTTGCSYVELSFYDGQSANKTSLQKHLCSGIKLPSHSVVQSSGRYAYLDLKYNVVSEYVEPAVALFRVYSVPKVCRDNHRTYTVDDSQSRVWISTDNTTQHSNCEIMIRSSEPDTCIKIHIHAGNNQELSLYDYFTIYDGSNTSARVYESRCSLTGKSYTFSTGPDMLLVRRLSPLPNHVTSSGMDGFWLDYSSDSSCDMADHTIISTDTNQYLMFQLPPPPNTHHTGNWSQLCHYVITTSSNQVIQLYLADDLQSSLSHSNCNENTAIVSDGIDGQNEIGWWCSGRGKDYVSHSNKVYITYMQKGNQTFQDHLPSVYYRSRPKEQCSQLLSGPKGSSLTISSPYYPKFYPNKADCSWKVTASSPNFRVEMQMMEMSIDIGQKMNCTQDYVAFYDGPSDTYPEIKRFCGQEVDSRPLRSSGEVMYVKFQSNEQTTAKGFQAKYKSVKLYKCNETLLAAAKDGPQQFLSSPFFPRNYGNNMACHWLLETTENRVIQTEMVLSEFTGSHSRCTGDRLTFYNGKDDTAPLIGRVCGIELPKYQSSGKHMYIVFKSDNDQVTARGFQLQYYSVFLYSSCQNGVVGRLHGNTTKPGYIASPFYPLGFPADLTCQWRLSVTPGHKVKVTVDRSDVTVDCNVFQVTFYDGPVPTGEMLGKWCGEEGRFYTSSGHTMYITFHSSKQTRSGFKLSYIASGSAISRSSTALIIGVIIGSIFFVIIIFSIGLCCCCCRADGKKKALQESESDKTEDKKNASRPLIGDGPRYVKESKLPDGFLVPSAPPMEDDSGIVNPGFTFGDDQSGGQNHNFKTQSIYPDLPKTQDVQHSVTAAGYIKKRKELDPEKRYTGQDYTAKRLPEQLHRNIGYPVQQIQEISLAQTETPVRHQRHLGNSRSHETSVCPIDAETHVIHPGKRVVGNRHSETDKEDSQHQNDIEHLVRDGQFRQDAEFEQKQTGHSSQNNPMMFVEIIEYGEKGKRQEKKECKKRKKKKSKDPAQKIAEPLKQSLKKLSSIECSEMESYEDTCDSLASQAQQDRHEMETQHAWDPSFQHPHEALSSVPFVLSPNDYLFPQNPDPATQVWQERKYYNQPTQWLSYHQQPSTRPDCMYVENQHVIQAEVHTPASHFMSKCPRFNLSESTRQKGEDTLHRYNVGNGSWCPPSNPDIDGMYPSLDTVSTSSGRKSIWSTNQQMIMPSLCTLNDGTETLDDQFSWHLPTVTTDIKHVPLLVPIHDESQLTADQKLDSDDCQVDLSQDEVSILDSCSSTHKEEPISDDNPNDDVSTNQSLVPPDPAKLNNILLPPHWISDHKSVCGETPAVLIKPPTTDVACNTDAPSEIPDGSVSPVQDPAEMIDVGTDQVPSVTEVENATEKELSDFDIQYSSEVSSFEPVETADQTSHDLKVTPMASNENQTLEVDNRCLPDEASSEFLKSEATPKSQEEKDSEDEEKNEENQMKLVILLQRGFTHDDVENMDETVV